MDILEKFIRQVSYKFPKGYPDLDNEADKKLLFELFEAETETTPKDRSIYDRIIAKVLTGTEDGEIPEPSRVYTVGKPVNLSGEDEQIFFKLYPISPPKSDKGIDSAGSKGSGNGEIAMHWLLSKGHTVEDTRGSDNPDLLIGHQIVSPWVLYLQTQYSPQMLHIANMPYPSVFLLVDQSSYAMELREDLL